MVGLASLVQQELQRDPFSGIMFVFRCKRADRIKLLLWDGTGLVLVTKRLQTGRFRWPRFGDGVMDLYRFCAGHSSHYATLASNASGLMPPRYEWRRRVL